MWLWPPLLVIVFSCSSIKATMFHISATQEVYEVEENRDVQLEWTFTTSPKMKVTSLTILCVHFGARKSSVLYRLIAGVEDEHGLDKDFEGRVQSDGGALIEGRISLLLSRVRLNDTGKYRCTLITGHGRNKATCQLNVIEALPPVTESVIAVSLYDWRLMAPVVTAAVFVIIAASAGVFYFLRKGPAIREIYAVHT